jgi:hypothetical protein
MIQQSNADNVDNEDDEQGNNGSAPKFHPGMIGARQAPDGNHYLPDPSRPGKYLRVDA